MCFNLLKKIKAKPIEVPVETPEEVEQQGVERPSPQGIIPKSATRFEPDKFIMKGKFVRMEPTGSDSMDPLLDKGDLVIGTRDFDKDKLQVGDIIVYSGIVHRIYSIEKDEHGRIYRTLGDNNAGQLDPWLIRNENIGYLVVGIIYLSKD